MKLATRARSRVESGFTLLEMMVAVTVFAVLGYGLAIAVDVGNHSQLTVLRVAAEDRSLRAATTSLIDELRSSSDTTIVITTLADGNQAVRFMLPIDVGGVPSWGVFDRSLGSDAASQNRLGWSLRYTVRSVPTGNGTFNKQLVRQLLDAAQTVQREKVMAEALESGTHVPPGFRMVKVGEVWELTLTSMGQVEGKAGISEVFHVQTRN